MKNFKPVSVIKNSVGSRSATGWHVCAAVVPFVVCCGRSRTDAVICYWKGLKLASFKVEQRPDRSDAASHVGAAILAHVAVAVNQRLLLDERSFIMHCKKVRLCCEGWQNYFQGFWSYMVLMDEMAFFYIHMVKENLHQNCIWVRLSFIERKPCAYPKIWKT